MVQHFILIRYPRCHITNFAYNLFTISNQLSFIIHFTLIQQIRFVILRWSLEIWWSIQKMMSIIRILKLMGILKELRIIQEVRVLILRSDWNLQVLVCGEDLELLLLLGVGFGSLLVEVIVGHLRHVWVLLLLLVLFLIPLFSLITRRYLRLLLSYFLRWSILNFRISRFSFLLHIRRWLLFSINFFLDEFLE